MQRTTLILDQETRLAARELAARYDCSFSEAIRRAVVQQRAAVSGVSVEARRLRAKALHHLIELFARNDADAEVARLKDEDGTF